MGHGQAQKVFNDINSEDAAVRQKAIDTVSERIEDPAHKQQFQEITGKFLESGDKLPLDKKLVELVDNDFIYEDLCSSIDSTKTSIMLTSKVIDKKDVKISKVINKMLSYGLKSPLYQEVREKKGLVYYVHCYQSRVNDKGINNISTLTSNKNFNEVVEVVKTVITNPDKYLTKERFNLVKEYYMVRKQKDDINRYGAVNQYINPKGWSVYDILDAVTLKKVREVYDKYYDFDKFYISSDKKEFKK
jgi:predicted Zn-dependent peptidase